MNLKAFEQKTALPLFYIGPDLSEGPLPTVLYLALSAKESLLTDPFNQAATHLAQSGARVFSVDLPFHGEEFDSREALKHWAHAFAQGNDIIGHFLLQLEESVSHLLSTSTVKNNSLAGMGLSRGGFLINHLAARLKEITTLLSFAPLTKISAGKDFDFLSLCPVLEHLDLHHLTEALCTKTQRIYIGNRDVRVGTDVCYQWIRALIELAFEKKIRSPHIEMILSPSIGHQGHGTSKENFEGGAAWLLKQILT